MQIDSGITPTLLVPADFSGNAVARFDEKLKELLMEHPVSVALDVSQMEHITSSHIRVLWRAYLTCSDAGVTMKLKSPSPGLICVLKVLDLHELFTDDQDSIQPQLRRAVKIESWKTSGIYADEFTADSRSVNRALKGFLKFLERLPVPDEVMFELRILFYEVATNISLHARTKDNDLIVFSCRVEGSKVIMVFADSGVTFDPTSSTADIDPQTASKNGQTRGFGLTLVRRLTDKMSYVRINDVMNVLTMEKKWD
jgi:anti-sigma regulatory factor (Ser/Thr protein kinase)/anti-anti-sigma regulatory factor